MQKRSFVAQDATGRVLPNASVRVYEPGTTTEATVYSDNSFTVLSQPFAAGEKGGFGFYAMNGEYDIAVTYNGNTSEVESAEFFDPNDLNRPSRANFVTAVAAGYTYDDGTVVDTGAVAFVASAGATAISDLLGFLPYGRPDLRHWTSAEGDGTTSVTSAVAQIITYLSGSLYFGDGGGCYVPPGLWLLTGTTSPWFTIRDSMTFYGDGSLVSCFVFNETEDVIWLFQPENVTTTTIPLSDVNFRDVGFINTTNPSNPFAGTAPEITDTMVALAYDRAVGNLDRVLVRDAQIDLLGTPEGMRITLADTTSNSTGEVEAAVENTAHIRLRPRVIASAIGASYQWTSGTGFDGNYYTYPNGVHITQHNMRAGASAGVGQTQSTILIEAVDGLYMTGGHVAWGTLAPLLVRPRHAQSPVTNIQCGTVLIDPLPGKSVHGIKAHDYWSQSATPASEWDFSNCILAGCTGTGAEIDLPMTGFKWEGGAVKGVGTTDGHGFEFTGSVDNARVVNTVFRNVGASSSNYCVHLDDCLRPYVDGISSAGGTYALVHGTSNTIDAVIGKVLATTLFGGETIEIPDLGAQFTVDPGSQIAETPTITAATTIKPPLGGPGAYITGTGTITAIDESVLFPGRRINLRFASTPTINETGNIKLGTSSLKLKQGQSIDLVYDATLGKACLVGSPIEYGSWTPVISDGSNSATSAAGSGGTYTKIGDTVMVRGIIILSSKGSISGSLRIAGLPYASVNNGGGGQCHFASGLTLANAGAIQCRNAITTDYLQLYIGDAVGNYTTIQDGDLTDTARFEFTAQYDMSA